MSIQTLKRTWGLGGSAASWTLYHYRWWAIILTMVQVALIGLAWNANIAGDFWINYVIIGIVGVMFVWLVLPVALIARKDAEDKTSAFDMVFTVLIGSPNIIAGIVNGVLYLFLAEALLFLFLGTFPLVRAPHMFWVILSALTVLWIYTVLVQSPRKVFATFAMLYGASVLIVAVYFAINGSPMENYEGWAATQRYEKRTNEYQSKQRAEIIDSIPASGPTTEEQRKVLREVKKAKLSFSNPFAKDHFTTVGRLAYTPNKHGWTSRSIALSESGEYRILCTSGYQQKYSDGTYKYYPCGGLGNSVPKEDSRFNPGAQLVRINGITYGAIPTTSVFTLSSGLQSLTFLPNVSLTSTEPGTSASSNFTGNKGSVGFIIQRKQS